MSVLSHTLEQGDGLRALGTAALGALFPRAGSLPPAAPGPVFEATMPPRSPALVRDFVRHLGGDPAHWRGVVPPHLFPQWTFGVAARALRELPWPLTRVLNLGARYRVNDVLRLERELLVRGRVLRLDVNEHRARVTTELVTGTREAPDALVAELTAQVPLAKESSPRGPRKAPPTVPQGAHELAFLRLSPDAGLHFAALTGDFNPLHWVPAWARAAGFRGCILHGFGTMARAVETLHRVRFAGDTRLLRELEVRFTRPLVLPARVGVYVRPDGGLWVGDAPGGTSYLEGHYLTEKHS